MSSKKEKLLGTKRKQCDKSMEHPRRPHRYRPGTKALRQVRPQTILEVCSDESIEETKEVSVGRKEDAHAPQKPPVPSVSVQKKGDDASLGAFEDPRRGDFGTREAPLQCSSLDCHFIKKETLCSQCGEVAFLRCNHNTSYRLECWDCQGPLCASCVRESCEVCGDYRPHCRGCMSSECSNHPTESMHGPSVLTSEKRIRYYCGDHYNPKQNQCSGCDFKQEMAALPVGEQRNVRAYVWKNYRKYFFLCFSIIV